MNKYDFDQLIQSARGANLADYFSQSAYTTQRYGDEIYIKEFPSLCVNMKSNKWFYHYEKVGGSNAIDCLVKVCGRDFKQAVYELTGRDIEVMQPKTKRCMVIMERPWLNNSPKPEPSQSPEKLLEMPVRGENMRRVFAYLCKERKIPAAIVEELARANLLYQSAGQIATTVNGIPQIARPPNAVFVHMSEDGKAIGGEVQGVNSYKRYKGLVAGTGDSVFAFSPFAEKVKTAYLFESGVDLMSFYALHERESLQGVLLISMAGLKPTMPNLLREQGLNVLSFVDNDEAGRKFEKDNGFKRGSDILEKSGVKDWNDLLLSRIENSVIIKIVTPAVPQITPEPITMKGITRK